MPILLAIETSSRRSSVAISRHGEVVYDSDAAMAAIESFDLAQAVAEGLERASLEPRDIAAVAVDVGPGGLNAVRAGVTFVNGLALALGVPVVAATSMAIMAHQAARSLRLPVICVRGATRENASLQIHDGRSPAELMHGELSVLARRIAAPDGPYVVAGRFRKELIGLLPGLPLVDSGIEGPTAAGLISLVTGDPATYARVAAPISIIYPDGPA